LRTRILTLVLALLLVLTLAGAAQAEEVTADGLLGLVPGRAADEPLTRGGFALMLVTAAEVAPAETGPAADMAAAVKALVAEGIMKGYPGGSLGLDQPVTRAQAAAFVARTLGLPESVDPGAVAGMEGLEKHWAFRSYAWMLREQLLDAADLNAELSAGEGAAVLARVFGPVARGRELNEKSQAAQQKIRSMRMQGTYEMQMRLRAGADASVPAELADLRITAETNMAVNVDQGIHQKATMTMPGGLSAPMTVEQYFTGEGAFMKMTDPMTGEAAWLRMPEGMFPDIAALLKQSVGQPVPPELNRLFYHRYLSEAELDGLPVQRIATYGRITDFEAMLSILKDQLGGSLGGSFEAMLAPGGPSAVGQMFKSFNIVGVSYLGRETLAPVRAEFLLSVDLAEEIVGLPNPIAGMTMNGGFTFSDFDADIVIAVPDEALKAPVLEMPVPPVPAAAGKAE